jgi:hypothetical protein
MELHLWWNFIRWREGRLCLEYHEAKDELSYQHCSYYIASFFFVFMLVVIILSFVDLLTTQ